MNALPPIPAPTAYFSNLSQEHGFEPVAVEGTLPAGLSGTLYRAGPGIMEQLGRRYDHLFEGDGAVTAIRFADGTAQAASRLVQSAVLLEERAAGRHLGSFAASWPERLRRIHRGGLKNTANTNLMCWQDRLYALMEGAKPTRIDPDTLETLGETDLGIVPGGFSAHPHRVAARRCLYSFGLSYGRQTTLDLFALPDVGDARLLTRLPLEKPVMLHDFAATEQHLVFFVAPLQLVLWRMLLAVRPFDRCFAWNPSDGTEVIVVPIDAPDRPVRFRTPAFMQFHFVGASEEEGRIAVDYIRYDNADLLWRLGDGLQMSMTDAETRPPSGQLHRAWVDPAKKTLTSAPLLPGEWEFPRTTTGGAVWLLGEEEIGGELRFRVSRIGPEGVTHCRMGRGEVCSEPVPVGEDVALVLVYDCFEAVSRVAVIEGGAVVATVRLKQAIPITFHGLKR